ncbi:MAG: inositol monophosphatase family protein [Gemmatimonadales bacterium]
MGEEAVSADNSALHAAREAEHWFTIDPVDGTRNFVHGSQDYAVMVAEMRRREVVRSWIWQPEHKLAYVAERGAGSWCGDRRLEVPTRDTLDPRGRTSRRALIGTSLGELSPLELTWVCCGVDYPKLAENACDYLLYGGAMPWDHAPGSLLVAEAGGITTYDDGTAYDPTTTRSPLVAAGSAPISTTVLAALDGTQI